MYNTRTISLHKERAFPLRIDLRAFLLLVAIGVAIRIVIVATTIGSNDVIFWMLWSNLIEKHGVLGAYAMHEQISRPPLHIALFPPLTLVLLRSMIWVARKTGLEVIDVLRSAQIVADLAATLALLSIERIRQSAEPYFIPLFYFLSPAVIFVSAFHCNTDPTMIMLVIVALLMMVRPGRESASGFALGTAIGIKIVPLFLVPFLIIRSGRRAVAFVIGFSTALGLIFGIPALAGGKLVIDRLLAYAGYPGKWGFVAVALESEKLIGASGTTILYRLATLYAGFGKYLVITTLSLLILWYWRKAASEGANERLLATVGLAFLIVLFLAPGFGVQYLMWPIAFLPFLLERQWALAVNAAISVYLFITYTIWAGGFPWWYADSMAPSPFKPWVIFLGFGLWGLLGYAGIRGFLRLRRVANVSSI